MCFDISWKEKRPVCLPMQIDPFLLSGLTKPRDSTTNEERVGSLGNEDGLDQSPRFNSPQLGSPKDQHSPKLILTTNQLIVIDETLRSERSPLPDNRMSHPSHLTKRNSNHFSRSIFFSKSKNSNWESDYGTHESTWIIC